MSSAVVTDLYEATMTLAYLREGMVEPATFSLFVRGLPPDRGFLVGSGLEQALGYLDQLHVDETDLATFAAALGRPTNDLAGLLGLRFTGDVWAVPEGRIVFAGEPLMEITAPLPEAQLVETYLLNQITYSTALASKAARCIIAAPGQADYGLLVAPHPRCGSRHAGRPRRCTGRICRDQQRRRGGGVWVAGSGHHGPLVHRGLR